MVDRLSIGHAQESPRGPGPGKKPMKLRYEGRIPHASFRSETRKSLELENSINKGNSGPAPWSYDPLQGLEKKAVVRVSKASEGFLSGSERTTGAKPDQNPGPGQYDPAQQNGSVDVPAGSLY